MGVRGVRKIGAVFVFNYGRTSFGELTSRKRAVRGDESCSFDELGVCFFVFLENSGITIMRARTHAIPKSITNYQNSNAVLCWTIRSAAPLCAPDCRGPALLTFALQLIAGTFA